MGRLWRILSESYAAVHGLVRYKELLFWAVIFPLILYAIFIAILGGPRPPRVTVGVYDGDPLGGNGTLGAHLVAALRASKLFTVKTYNSTQTLLHALKVGQASAGLAIPANFTESITSGRPAGLRVYTTGSLWGLYSRMLLGGFLSSYEDSIRASLASGAPAPCRGVASLIADPVNVSYTSISPPLLATRAGVKAYHAVNMVGLEALFIGLYTGALSINERKRSGTLRVLLASPMNGWELLAADTLGALSIAAFSAFSVIAASLAVGARYTASPTAVAASLVLGLTAVFFTISLGLLVAPLARTPEGAGALVNAIGFPVMFAGGVLVPPSALPGALGVFAAKWPLGQALEAARSVLLYGEPPSRALWSALPAMLVTAALYVLGGLVYLRLLERSAEYY